MNNKLLLITVSLLMITVLFSLNSCSEDNVATDSIQVTGVEFKPNFFKQNGHIAGIDADIAALALQNAGVEFKMSMSASWQNAYNATLNGHNNALLTTAYLPERENLFKWAGPISQSMYGIFKNGDSDLVFPLPIEDCRSLPQIAVVRNWLETNTLEDLGFTNLVYFNTYKEALDAFVKGEIKYIASDFYHLVTELPAGFFWNNVNTVTRYRTVYNYIAFSKNVSDVVVEKVQKAIETLIKNQTVVSIVKNYIPLMPSDYIPGSIQLFTENSPPSNYMTGTDTTRKVEGSSVDIVNEIQRRTGHVDKINMSVWSDAYAVVQYLPNSAIFTTVRTPERENLFQWVGPISTSRAYIYTLANSGLTVNTLEQAKGLQSIATPNGWFTHDFLKNNNFLNVVATSRTSMDAFKQLINGEVQAILLTELDVKWLADIIGVETSILTRHIEVMNFKDYIAFSLITPASTVQQWQKHLDDMKSDGKFETIWNKWFEGVPMP